MTNDHSDDIGADNRPFIEAINHSDDLLALLRGHLYIEAALDRQLVAHMPHSEPLLRRMNFATKLRVARDEKFIDKPLWNAIDTINDIRNDFAQNVDRTAFTRNDVERLLSNYQGGWHRDVFTSFAGFIDPDRMEFDDARLFIALVYVLLSHQAV